MTLYGVTFNPKRKLFFELQKVPGIGATRSKKILQHFKLSADVRVSQILELDTAIYSFIEEKYPEVASGVRELRIRNIKRKMAMHSFAGQRLIAKLPLKGGTRRNSRTARKAIV